MAKKDDNAPDTGAETEEPKKDDKLRWVRATGKDASGAKISGDRIVLLETDPRHPTPDGQVHVAGDMKTQVFPTPLVLQRLREGIIEETDPPKKGDTVLGGNPLHEGGNPNAPLAK
jgi:hypothetical protein